MNEHIEELWIKSWTTEAPGYDYQKFAELIVGECAGICDNDYVRCGQDGAGWRLAREIEEHFGVE